MQNTQRSTPPPQFIFMPDTKKRISSTNHGINANADCATGRKSKRTKMTSGTDPDASPEPQTQVGPHPPTLQMPEKHVLQLIIDILQRRDTYEIFAEPVDPNEVEDYYQIVKEPMDFGTMRAKLHEGMYRNLDQFKHDVFLITRNAMHFNSSATIYFRQARAIHELAKRIFHVLTTAPQNFELKFSGTRRRPTRRTPTLVKPSNAASSVSPNGTSSSVATSIIGQNLKGNSWVTGLAAVQTTKRNYCDDRKSNQVGKDRRCTYRPKSCPLGLHNDPVDSKCPLPNTLIFDTNYMKSLWSFVHDLGPTARTIATQKIRGLHERYPCAKSSTGLGFRSREQQVAGAPSQKSLHGSSCWTVLKQTTSSDVLGKVDGGEGRNSKKRVPKRGEHQYKGSTGKENDKAGQSHDGMRTEFWVGSSSCSSPEPDDSAKSSSEGKQADENVLPVVLALEHSQSHSHASVAPNECKWKNKTSCSSKGAWASAATGSGIQQSRAPQSSGRANAFSLDDDAKVRFCSLDTPMQKLQTVVESGKDETNEKIRLEEEEMECHPRPFTFNLGFLKAQLYQMNMNV